MVLTFEEAPANTPSFRVGTPESRYHQHPEGIKGLRQSIIEAIQNGPVVLDFENYSGGTQGTIHEIAFEPIRVAWALKKMIHITNAPTLTRGFLTLIESYALVG